ncbi:hypothetical protein Syun_027585 [Stephania yunnanensis]|uniref:Uncharacterized protein n=1 Tax=Stephania yunnanensis TaxID=152371 RepID=A0AAP0EG68_9MAGN
MEYLLAVIGCRTFEEQARLTQASATNEDMPRQLTPLLATNERPPRVATSVTATTSHTALFSSRVSDTVDMPWDPCLLRLPDFRHIHANSSSAVLRPPGALLSARRFLALNVYPDNISSSTDQKLDRIISMMEHLLSSGEVQVNPAMDSSYPHNYGRYKDSDYYNVNGVEIVIALNEGEDEMNIDVNSDKPEKPQIKSEEDQLLVFVQPPTLPCTFGTPYKGVEVREHL